MSRYLLIRDTVAARYHFAVINFMTVERARFRGNACWKLAGSEGIRAHQGKRRSHCVASVSRLYSKHISLLLHPTPFSGGVFSFRPAPLSSIRPWSLPLTLLRSFDLSLVSKGLCARKGNKRYPSLSLAWFHDCDNVEERDK